MLEFEPIQRIIEAGKTKVIFYPKRIDEGKGLIENAKMVLEDYLRFGSGKALD
jgi:hypothetical protein